MVMIRAQGQNTEENGSGRESKKFVTEMTKRCQNYREAHNIHGDEQVRFDKKKQNQEADAKKYGPQKDKVHQNETNTKQTNAKPYTFNSLIVSPVVQEASISQNLDVLYVAV